MSSRRAFLSGILAAGLMPKHTWADAGRPSFLSAGMKPGGAYVLCGLDASGQITFECPLPARGHAAAAHPTRAEAVAFARRPGTYAIVLDCTSGQELARLSAPEGRHFYGHGTFSADGAWLFTTENDFDAARGMIGVWARKQGFRRIGEFPSHGVGPHDIKLMPDGHTLVVANGGIETHPETGRAKLNIPSMRPNLTYLDLDGHVLSQIELDPAHRKNSIRHLAVSETGNVVFAMQWQGDLTEDLPLLGVHDRQTSAVRFLADASVRRMQGYLGSVAVSRDGKMVATTSPRSGRVLVFEDGSLKGAQEVADVCGVAAGRNGFITTSGTGLVKTASGDERRYPIAWDNHLVPI